jgi:hypothetical protein
MLLQVGVSQSQSSNAIYISIGAALLAAAASLYSAHKSANTATELKDRDYKYAFYQKVIDKRLTAWQNAETIINKASATVVVLGKEIEMPAFFISDKAFLEMLTMLRGYQISSIWLSVEYANALSEYHNWLSLLHRKCEKTPNQSAANPGFAEALEVDLHRFGMASKEENAKYLNRLFHAVGDAVAQMDDIERFLKMLSSQNLVLS